MKIFVDNLAFEIMDDFVRAAFEQFGRVNSAVIAREHNSADSRGYAFVDMPDDAEAQKAIDGMNGKEMMGRPIEVTKADPDSEARHNRQVETNRPRNYERTPRQRFNSDRKRSVGKTSTPASRYGKLG